VKRGESGFRDEAKDSIVARGWAPASVTVVGAEIEIPVRSADDIPKASVRAVEQALLRRDST
jgi:hypothetical protein